MIMDKRNRTRRNKENIKQKTLSTQNTNHCKQRSEMVMIMGFNTNLLHDGVMRDEKGATLPPIYQSSAFEQDSAAELEGIFANRKMGYCYTRVGNPTVAAFENRMAKLERGAAAIACVSGMAALMSAMLGILQSGDEIISSASLYGGTIDLFRDLEAFGITTKYVTSNDRDAIEAAFSERTRLVFAETIGNPCLDVTDLKKTAEIAHAHNVPLIVDNTTATPYLVRALEQGADIVVHSSSKYINGTSNSISGVIVYSGKFRWDFEKYPGLKEYKKFGPMCFIAKLRNGLFRNMGACLSPMNAYLNVIGMETLGLRMDRQCKNALALAKWIDEAHPEANVNYPGLEKSEWHEIAKGQFENGYGGILTLRLGSKEKAFKFIDSLKLALKVSNIGDTKTLVIHPMSTISLHSTEEEKQNAGVFEDLVRVSVGIEEATDLIQDFENAFQQI